MMDQVDAQLGKLTKTGLEADDHAALEQIKAVAVMLRPAGEIPARLLEIRREGRR